MNSFGLDNFLALFFVVLRAAKYRTTPEPCKKKDPTGKYIRLGGVFWRLWLGPAHKGSARRLTHDSFGAMHLAAARPKIFADVVACQEMVELRLPQVDLLEKINLLPGLVVNISARQLGATFAAVRPMHRLPQMYGC